MRIFFGDQTFQADAENFMKIGMDKIGNFPADQGFRRPQA